MPDISAIIIKDISFFSRERNREIVPEKVKKFIREEFYCQLKMASELFGKPTFARNVTIFLTENERCFNSENDYMAVQDYCVNWVEGKSKWNLQEALSHEIVHLIVDNAPGQPYRTPPFVMEEGIAYYNTQKLGYAHYDNPGVLNANNIIRDALKEVPDLLTRWRNLNGEAPVVQVLRDVDLKRWGLGTRFCELLLADFK